MCQLLVGSLMRRSTGCPEREAQIGAWRCWRRWSTNSAATQRSISVLAGHYPHSLVRTRWIALPLGAAVSVVGLTLSRGHDSSVGRSIMPLAGGVFIVSAIVALILDRRRGRRAVSRGMLRG
ncbi:hypothetical protein CKO41_02735 [Thiococcus pfennigii]|nr:hypothetical protein [Thiococcus pfennigii]